jgi:hypothetical protein
MPYEDLDIYALWTVNVDTEYRVHHLLQNVYDDGYTKAEEVTLKT